MKKKILCFMLAAMMIFSAVGCGQKPAASTETNENTQTSETAKTSETTESTVEEEAPYPEYLNLDTYFPLVKEGEEVTLKIAMIESTDFNAMPREDTFFWKLVEEKMNINVEIEQVSFEGYVEYYNMMFASDDVPDIVFSIRPLTADQLVTYGTNEHQLLDFAPYMEDANLMPNINRLFEEYPDLKASITLPDGGIYSQVQISDKESVGIYNRRMIDMSLVEGAGKTMPTTLDEFVDTMYAIKEKYPDVTPIGGSYRATNSPNGLILNALGYLDNASADVYAVGVRNGEAGIPAADKEIYGEYLNIMKGFFDNGIIHRDYFTMDDVATAALIQEGDVATTTMAWTNPKNFDSGNWKAVPALTSEYSSDAQVGRTKLYTLGKVFASAKTEYPEVVARLLDFLYSDEGLCLYEHGPCETQTEYMEFMDNVGWKLDEAGEPVYLSVLDGTYESNKVAKQTVLSGGSITMGNQTNTVPYRQTVMGWTTLVSDYDIWTKDGLTKNAWWRCETYDAYRNTAAAGMPTVFLSADDSVRANELYSVLLSHMETETIKFITGSRDLSELDTYFKELDKLGYQEYIGYYQEAYESYLAN